MVLYLKMVQMFQLFSGAKVILIEYFIVWILIFPVSVTCCLILSRDAGQRGESLLPSAMPSRGSPRKLCHLWCAGDFWILCSEQV